MSPLASRISTAPGNEEAPGATLALSLALLAVPGSTVAWDLPAGGLWLGLPLAVTAIVLALRSRRDGRATRRSLAAIVVAGACLTLMSVWIAVSELTSDASAHAPSGRTPGPTELERAAAPMPSRTTAG